MRLKKIPAVLLLCLGLPLPAAVAAEQVDPRAVAVNLIEQLVKDGTLTRDKADEILKNSKLNANDPNKPPAENEVRIQYIPEDIKQKIRDDIRTNLQKDVVMDVLGQAKQEQWGVPGVLPEWINRIKFSGDFRLRAQRDGFSGSNSANSYPNYIAWNIKGNRNAINFNLTNNTDFYNTTVTDDQLRLRFRFGMQAEVNNTTQVVARLATGNTVNPVSTNQTLGNSYRHDGVVLDRVYVNYTNLDKNIHFLGGRMPNPFLNTDLVWDDDLNFDGVALRWLPSNTRSFQLEAPMFHPYVTVGAFPLKKFDLRRDDRWLYGTQLGFNWDFDNQSRIDFGLAYYYYKNITGVKNTPNSTAANDTAMDYMQKGNTLYDISNDTVNPNTFLYGLAAKYRLVDAVIRVDLAQFSPAHVIFTSDYVKNVGYDQNDVLARTAGSLVAVNGSLDLAPRNKGYMYKLAVGWPYVGKQDDWQVSLAYKHLERDAVLDAFTDSDFLLGGTDAKGYILSMSYGIGDESALGLRYMSADSIDGVPLSVDTLQLDWNVRF
ncbi:MAG: putative porin [Gammaproteobacteria bacterium]|nr:putative porin [Gammaproteobacteria bacterium]